MHILPSAVLFAAAIALPYGGARAQDVYDALNDKSRQDTLNRLTVGAPFQRHHLGPGPGAEADWFRVNAHPLRSYEVQVRNANGAVLLNRYTTGSGPAIQAGSPGFGVPLYSGSPEVLDPLPIGFTAFPNFSETTMTWIEPYAGGTGRIGVVGGAAREYEIAMRETTLYCPRYNNTGTQSSVLIIQRVSAHDYGDQGCFANAFFYGEDRLLKGYSLNQPTPRNAMVIAAGNVPGVPGTRGHVVIPHSCGHGGLQAKIAKLDPVTGFAFDTICKERTQ